MNGKANSGFHRKVMRWIGRKNIQQRQGNYFLCAISCHSLHTSEICINKKHCFTSSTPKPKPISFQPLHSPHAILLMYIDIQHHYHSHFYNVCVLIRIAAAVVAVPVCKRKKERKKITKRVYCLGTIWNVITIRIAIQTNLFLFSHDFDRSVARTFDCWLFPYLTHTHTQTLYM